jgi:hypothetical protein
MKNMISKRIKISFNTINKDNLTIISKKEIAESNQILKENMKNVVRKHVKNQILSQQQSSKFIINR